jgi:peptidoglycan/xylan/chitin deacetylase (PgdA/CDA1 family)
MIENPLEFNRDAQALLLDKGVDIIQQATGVAPVGYRAPLYNYTNDTTDLLIERGFKYDASLMGDDIPYILRSQGKPH